jgi:hypothetical protein
MQPPRVCSDPIELREETERLLQTPVGNLYASRATAEGGREDAYDLAYDTIKKAEYLQFGHASHIPGTIYASSERGVGDPADAADPLASMKRLVVRMQQEGEIYLQLRRQKQRGLSEGTNAFGGSGGDDDLSATDDRSSSSSSDESDSSSDDDDSDDEADVKSRARFAPPGPTAKLQEAVLDVMACVGTAAPGDYYETAITILQANDRDQGANVYTLPSHVTYNAALRGISRCKLSDEAVRDEALSSAFSLYNHLSHSLHLPRNSATFVYMLHSVNNIFPASRVKGNISVTLWDHATRLGVADANVVEAMKLVLGGGNGPEFDVLTDELSKPIPQKCRRFVNKYRYSDNY